MRGLLAIVLLGAAHAPGSSQSINCDIDVGSDLPSSDFPAAANQPGFWNSTYFPEMRDLAGRRTRVSLHWLNVSAWGWHYNPSNSGGYAALLNDGVQILEQTRQHWYFKGLQNGKYKLYTYAVSLHGGHNNALIHVREAIANPLQMTSGASPGNVFIEGVTHCVHDVLVSQESIFITAMLPRGSTAYGHINGFQLVKTE